MSESTRTFLLFVATAIAVPLLEALIRFDTEMVLVDPKPWAIGLATAVIRSAASAILARVVTTVPHG